ncbi:AAA family ATPase [Paenibacillus ehimensis]|uniref:AAA family ATPase n=1 Tax=Paenibacillus ehimensis TaxID=79264 RepID=A0ABT8VGS2_9BACL|nr:ATP-binding protein [Paenibacillus ehimensis]MDO3680175.1 AAA family ATPase [Paenibacillus ehimensis]
MQIRKIWIKKLGGLRDFHLVFPNPSEYHFGKMKVSILVGENGTGKTSILKFLSRIFVDDKYSKFLKTSFSLIYEINDVENTMSDYNNYTCFMPEKVIVSSYSAFEPYKHNLSANDYKSEYIYLGTLGKGPIGPVASLSSVCIPILETFFHPDRRKSTAINELLNEIGYVDFPLIQISFMQAENYISKNYDRLKTGKLNENHINEIQYLLDKLHYFHRDVLNIKRTNGRHLIDPYMLNQYIDGPHGWLEDVKRLANIPGGINVVKSLSFKKGEDLVPLSELSSGELSMFFRFFKLIAAIGDNSIVLIDEPETHLHPRWIQKYLNMIKSIFSGYDTHFIIATHSPLIAADVPNESIIGLRKNEKGMVEQYTVNEQTLGTSPQEILREVFKLDNHLGDFTSNTISNINKLIDKGKIDLAKKLYDDLGDSDEKFSLFLRMKQQLDKGN